MAKAAKRRKKDEDPEFVLPEFDETAYMRKEVEATKASFVVIALAVPVGALLSVITVNGLPIVAFFLGLGLTFLLPRFFRFLPWPKVDVAKFERRDWLGYGGTFFFTWLAVWILLLNVPFVDITDPVISSVTVNGRTVRPNVQTEPPFPPGDFTINATIHENAVLQQVEFVVDGRPVPPQVLSRSTYGIQIRLLNPPPNHDIAIRAVDGGGREALFAFKLRLV